MSRIVIAASLAVAVASAVSLSARQARPDLSGKWTLVPDLSTPANTHAFGMTLVVSQSGETVALEQQTFNIQFVGAYRPSTRSETGGTMRTEYVADGADHDLPVQTATPTAPANARVVMSSALQAKSYRAVWAGRQLIIMTRDSLLMSRPNSEPVTIRRTIRQALTLSADGSLIGESLIVADPIPGAFFFNAGEMEQPAPVPVRSIYRR